ncbi:NADH-quinone oxidoreductase subunit N [Streptomyces litchfieldiae]|uniref:NADH-quinone oxidoreductase subunit N n=1 Tax=Streptomyces litchfieldiae TaxID=3075543 RepID=A0ABU2MYK0_9ACTN|nr:NADH-quinone oxidoreductase subunit N [Streptomyces sp. DSM 44938]MDT0346732.1 NADH-quinone oxidoreductase subunit N [Streptomyces sp. DSM 44938]
MNLVQSVEWAVVAPPLIAAVAAVAVLVADLFLPEGRKAVLGWLAAGGLALAALALLPLRAGDRATFCLPDDPALCSYAADRFAVIVQLLVLGGAFLVALLSVPETGGAAGGDGKPLPGGEFWFLLLSSASGAALLPAARDLATLIIALEVTTLPAYALVALRRSGTGPEAALKFFLSSVTATAVGLLGVSFVYAAAGSLYLAEIAEGLPEADPRLATLAEAGVVLTLVAFAFKTAAVPFHFWVPETYLGAPLPVAGYLSVVGKTAGLAGLILVTAEAFPGYGDLWGPALAVLAGLTMTAGNVAALRTDPAAPGSAVRLLAWSSIGQAGYLLVPIAAAAYAEDTVGTTVAYALMYGAVNLGAFAVAAYVARHRAAHRIADYRGLWARQPLAALALAFFLLCLAGLPPGVIGLFAKVAVFETAVAGDLGVLAVVMAVNVVIALYYYLRWAAVLFTGGEEAAGEPAGEAVAEAGPGLVTEGGAAVATRPAVPLPLMGAIVLAAGAGLALSGAPQLVLTFVSGTLL